jgi:hypothetical protein
MVAAGETMAMNDAYIMEIDVYILAQGAQASEIGVTIAVFEAMTMMSVLCINGVMSSRA